MLAALLSGADTAEVSGRERVTVLRARQRMISFLEAGLLADMAAIVESVAGLDDLDDELVFRAAAAEVRVALRLTRRAADDRVEFALTLRRRLPRVWKALAAGRIDVRRARVIERGTAHLAETVARQVVDEVLADAGGLTTGQLGARVRRLCIDVDPGDAEDRYRVAVEDRRMVVEATESGTANLLGLDLPPDRVAAIGARINHLAKGLRRDGESRTMDQLRADVFLDLLDGEQRGTGGVVEVRVDLATLARLENHPGDLGGYGPVIAEIGRAVAHRFEQGTWRGVVTDPDSGAVLGVGALRRRPKVGLRREVEVAHRTCVFPGCRMPAVDCDLDHRTRWVDGGSTEVSNLAPLCRHGHILKDSIGWWYRPLPGGDYEWSSLLGCRYTTSGRSP